MSSTSYIDLPTILTRLDWSESDDLEFKSAKGGLPQSLWETYSAMANSQGGVVLLGVEDNGIVSGVTDVGRLKKNFWNIINNRGKINSNLLANCDVVELPWGNTIVLAIHVPRATRIQRPVFLNQNPLTGTYRRNFEGDYHCTEQEVSRMLADRAENPADSRVLEGVTLHDLDLLSLQQYRHRFASFKPTHPWLSEDDIGLLSKLGGWRRHRTNGNEGLTVAGLLMFGKEEALREVLPQYHVDYREKLSDDPDVRWTDRLTIDGTWPGNLFQFYLRVIQHLAADLKIPFKLDGELFRKDETPVHEAIREALVNALIHADYQGMGGIVVEKYRDRFEFSNPGTLLISFEQLLRGNVSECRNKSLQTMFSMIGVGEKAGSGIDKIRRGWESQHWRSPKVSEQFQPDRVQWMLPMMSLIPEKSLKLLQGRFGERFQHFSPLEVQALVTADLEEGVDNARMRQITGSHAADITAMLQKLVAGDVLRQEGKGRWTRYYLPNVIYGVTHSLHKEDHSLHKENHSLHKENHSLHKEEIKILQEIASLAVRKKRLNQKEMESIILRLCNKRWLSRNQLAELVARSDEGLRQRYLNPMVEHNLLRLRYPDKPNRTDQAYTTV